MWLAALAGRLAFLIHRLGGHAVTWKAWSQNACVCPGDIVCHECGQVLWCRAHDPWRAARGGAPPDHWGSTSPHDGSSTLLDRLQHVLRLAEACPSGPSGDAIRRAACELVEADSSTRRAVCRRRMLKCVVRLQERSRRRSANDDPPPLMLNHLAAALRSEPWVWS